MTDRQAWIVVGIAYGGEEPDVHALRARDYTPTPQQSRPGSGGAPDFLRFLEAELFPFVEERYPSDRAQRVIAGASLGGLFSLYVLFERPELFYGYISMTPALHWDDSFIVRRERDLRAHRPTLARRLFLSFGGAEDADKGERGKAFMTALEKARYPELSLKTLLVEGERHAAVKNESYNRGLRFVFAPLAPRPAP